MYGLLDISDKEFQDISRLVHSRFGINLTDKKVTLVKGRLNKLIRERGYTSFSQYYKAVMEDTTGAELLGLVDKISTNHTYFFRENDHFQVLRERILPETLAGIPGGDLKELKIWCAGCSSGEEAYTLAIELLDFARSVNSGLDSRIILATDISLTALEAAAKGEYVAERVRGVSREHLARHFVLTPAGTYRVKDNLRSPLRINYFAVPEPLFEFFAVDGDLLISYKERKERLFTMADKGKQEKKGLEEEVWSAIAAFEQILVKQGWRKTEE